MTVAELIRALQALGPDAQSQKVYVNGDESGDFPVIAADADCRLSGRVSEDSVMLTTGDVDYDGDEEE